MVGKQLFRGQYGICGEWRKIILDVKGGTDYIGSGELLRDLKLGSDMMVFIDEEDLIFEGMEGDFERRQNGD